jgi:hypothetical protein
MQQGRHIAHKFESGWEVGVIKAFDKKDPHAGKFSVKYKRGSTQGGYMPLELFFVSARTNKRHLHHR